VPRRDDNLARDSAVPLCFEHAFSFRGQVDHFTDDGPDPTLVDQLCQLVQLTPVRFDHEERCSPRRWSYRFLIHHGHDCAAGSKHRQTPVREIPANDVKQEVGVTIAGGYCLGVNELVRA
jgi:hypothetical protein